jgi:hypothetical protein
MRPAEVIGAAVMVGRIATGRPKRRPRAYPPRPCRSQGAGKCPIRRGVKCNRQRAATKRCRGAGQPLHCQEQAVAPKPKSIVPPGWKPPYQRFETNLTLARPDHVAFVQDDQPDIIDKLGSFRNAKSNFSSGKVFWDAGSRGYVETTHSSSEQLAPI